MHDRLLRAFQDDAYTISSVYEWIRVFRTERTIVLDGRWAERSRFHHIDSKSLSLFTENTFHSVGALAHELGLFLSTVYDRLVNVLGSSLRHARSVPHLLTEELKAQRISMSIEMLRILQAQELMNFAEGVTGDESLFFLEYSRNRVWRLGNENASERVSQKISTEKHMLTVFCSAIGPLVEEWLSRHDTFNRTYFCEIIIRA
jgi:hypothetical protein